MSVPISVICCVLLLIPPFRFSGSFVKPVIGILITIAAAVLFNKYMNTWGLYIEGTQIYYKNIFKQRIEAKTIAAIKISRAVMRFNRETIDLIDRHGNPLYSMILIKAYNPMDRFEREMTDYSFCLNYREHIICRTIYSQSAIDHLKTLNPNIVVIPAIEGTFQNLDDYKT